MSAYIWFAMGVVAFIRAGRRFATDQRNWGLDLLTLGICCMGLARHAYLGAAQ